MTSGAPHESTDFLPDGRTISCTSPSEMLAVWEDVTQNSAYLMAVQGLGSGALIADVGAHYGLAAVFFADHVPHARILAFEPAPPTFECLRDNLSRHVPGGRPFRYALGARPGNRKLTYSPVAPCTSTIHVDNVDDRRTIEALITNTGGNAQEALDLLRLRDAAEQSFSVPTTTLTEVFKEHNVGTIDLLKIDVERAEIEVLDGVNGELWPRIRRIVMEVHDIDDGLANVANRLRARQYEVTVSQPAMFRRTSLHMVTAMRY
ncbi:FkbM family methyltransferase [Streptomyces sp. NBC_01750]|uniref:FkbM family methyltransferase n=1 Tax=Streptomyces sp. NBC_01750 TaxID=2975928 RepID=UPI002DDA7EE2|nr:FkbM family methyltransferase [Streptomyces sp. NBC_01750]WSD36819.1 FkbM family methyltransferase [Streptomyces sp. NBC_01750]